MATIAGIVLSTGITSGFLQVLMDRIAKLAEEKISQTAGLDEEFNELQTTLRKAQRLVDLVEKEPLVLEACQILLEDIKTVILDADDLLDEIGLGLERSNPCDVTLINKNQVRKLVLSSFKFNIPSELSKKKKELVELVEKLQEGYLSSTNTNNLGQPPLSSVPPTTSLVDESSVIGRATDKDNVKRLVLSEQEEKLSVITIVGMGAVGKTTLAQLVFHDPDVVQNFNFKMWVSVSLSDDVVSITASILKCAREELPESSDLLHMCSNLNLEPPVLNHIQIQLKNKLRNKKFLLVLDGLWNENLSHWDKLKLPFLDAEQGSKIVMTTRNEIVSSRVSATHAYHLHTLSQNDCWRIIKQTSLLKDGRENEANGLRIAEKCKGLPLAAKAIGDFLRCKSAEMNREMDWNSLLRDELWELELRNQIYPVLKSSYDNMPAYLKRCFSYCSIFPHNYKFEKDDLVHLWAAEGFIQARGRNEVEDIGREYFSDLCSRSLFLVDHPRYAMHNFIHDLARSVSTNLCFCMEDNMPIPGNVMEENTCRPRNIRYFSLLCQNIQPSTLTMVHRFEKLRTFLLLSDSTSSLNHVPYDFFLKLKCLRVLNLSRSGIFELPDSIENLKHLRYLNLSATLIKKVPKSIASLYGLETLKLQGCPELFQLPENIKNCIKLRHLNFDRNKISSMPIEVGKLTGLETLDAFIVGNDKGYQIEEIKNMRRLRGSICIKNLENVADKAEAETAMLDQKQYLDELELQWSEIRAATVNQEVPKAEQVIEGLKPSDRLKELQVTGYHGSKFPNWIGGPLFRKLERICLKDCGFCTLLPSLGQLPVLKYLLIQGMTKLEGVDHQFCGSAGTFPSLETLKFFNMPKWIVWSGLNENGMPRLRELIIDSCPELVTLPSVHYLTSLEVLAISSCPQLQSFPDEGLPLSLTSLIIYESDILKEWCKGNEGEDWNKIRSIRSIVIDHEVISEQVCEN